MMNGSVPKACRQSAIKELRLVSAPSPQQENCNIAAMIPLMLYYLRWHLTVMELEFNFFHLKQVRLKKKKKKSLCHFCIRHGDCWLLA